jgi:hypothetical protein
VKDVGQISMALRLRRLTVAGGSRRTLALLVAALLIGGLSLAPRGVEVTVHNMTDSTWVVRVESGRDVAWTPSIAPRGHGTAVVCPAHDSSIQLAINVDGRPVVHDLRVYTFPDAIGSASATIHGNGDGNAPTRISSVCHDSGYSVWSILPHGLFVRGWMTGLAVGLVCASWISFSASRGSRRQRTAAMEDGAAHG